MLDTSLFCKKHPTLYHVASKGAWPQIERHGLLSTDALQRLYNVDETTRLHIAEMRRSQSYLLSQELLGVSTIRDQVPLNLKVLSRVLDGMTVAAWRRILDCRVFFFPRFKGAEALMNAKLNRQKTWLVIEVDSFALFEAYASQIEVADINTGTALRNAPRRGTYTFQRPYFYKKIGSRSVLEVTVLDGIPDILQFVRRAGHYMPSGPARRSVGAA